MEETSVVTENETAVAPVVEPPREPTKPLYTCGHCGAKVVPEEHDTPTGKVYRCPKCGKFMKLKTPEEVKERREAEKGPLPPYEVMLTDRVKELLAENLPRVHGIPQKEATKTMAAILDTLNPEAASNPWNLHNHVKNFAPNADDRHLESIIKKVFGQLEVEGYVKAGRAHRPSYGRMTEEGYRPSYARGRRDDGEDYGEEDYGDYERRRRHPTMKIVVQGKEIETDYEGYLAHERWKREIAEETRRAEEHELRMKRLEAEILKISGETGGSRSPGPYEEIREFIDAEGKLCDPEKAVSVRIKRVPVATESTDIKELREELRVLEKTVKDKEMSELREEIKGLKEKPGESEEIKALREQLGESRKSIEDLKGTIEAKEKQVFLDKINGLETRLSNLAATGTGDWKSDEIRLIKGSISDIKDLLQTYLSGERPLDKAERILTGGPAGVKPPSEMAGEAEREGVIQELRKHGLVTKVIERVRG